jgi:site-specific recombinase
MSFELKAITQLSKMGNREVARSTAACVKNLIYAGGAGMLTAFTVALKIVILHSPLPLIVGAGLSSLNFIGSFLLMQAFGFRLATKQAPLLGAGLGRRWQELRSLFARRTHLRKLWRNEVYLSVRTQLFSASGNLIFVIPATFVFCTVFRLQTGSQFLDPHMAEAALASLNPWRTATLAYAILTGGLLWLCTYLGGVLAQRFSPFSKTLATVFFNICLGALLAFVPMLGRGLGLPLDVRHFTLSSGTLAAAVTTLGLRDAWSFGLPSALLGILAIGALNFSVSFALAFVAARAGSGPNDLESAQAQALLLRT